MQLVGDHLCSYAISLAIDDSTFDEFARSSYNRYYYAAFMNVRSACSIIVGRPVRVPHKEMPNYLRTEIAKLFKQALLRAWKTKCISDANYARDVAAVAANLRRIGTILEIGYAARCVADYEPAHLVQRVGAGVGNAHYLLRGTDVRDAKQWPKDVVIAIGSVLNVWRRLGN